MSAGGRVLRVMSSLPRSGTHWIKLLISHLLGEPPLDERILEIEKLQLALREDAARRLIYDHFEFDIHGQILDKARYPDLRMIILFRHPLDTLISMYYRNASEKTLHDNSRGAMENLHMFIDIHKNWKPIPECFHNHPKYHLFQRRDYLRFYIRNYVVDWLRNRDCFPVKFEDMLSEPRKELRRVARYFDISFSADRIEEALDLYNFEKLSGGRKPGEIDPDSHYRRGIVGAWREVIKKEDLDIVQQQVGDYLTLMGYQLS